MNYQRLPGKGRKLFGKHTLWLGEDHLLAVDNNGYIEYYRRYYLKDIQAFLVRRTGRGTLWSIFFGFMLLLAAAGMANTDSGNIGAIVTWSIIAGLFLLLLLVNLFRGPTCRCWIKTPLGTAELGSLRRLRNVDRFTQRVRPLMDRVQGRLTPEEMAAQTASGGAAPFVMNDQQRKAQQSKIHEAAFALLLLTAAWTVQLLFNNGMAVMMVAFVLHILLFFCIVAAVARQGRLSVARGVKALTWGALATVTTEYFIGYFFFIFFMIQNNPAAMTDNAKMLRTLAGVQPMEHTFLSVVLVVYAAASAIIGIIGLFLVRRHAGSSAVPPIQAERLAP